MATSGYDYANMGVLQPFVIESILGGELNLLPSPEKIGSWLTWGFNPYDAGNEYSDVSEIPVEGAVMRVPMFHVNLAGEDMKHDFIQYLSRGIRLIYRNLHELLNDLSIDNAADGEFTTKISHAVTQLGNMVRVAGVFNMMPIVQEGTLSPIKIRFGKRYRVREVNSEPLTIEQDPSVRYDVIDLGDGTIVSTWDNKDDAEVQAWDLNASNDEIWVASQVQALAATDERLTTTVQEQVIAHLIDSGRIWGDEIVAEDIDAALK